MTKYELILQEIKFGYNLALARRDSIRNRINVVAAFGFATMTFLASSIFEKLNANSALLNKENIYLWCLTAVSFIFFVISYLIAFGSKTIQDYDLEKLYDELNNLTVTDKNMGIVFDNQHDYYKENGIDNSIILAENDALYSYLSNAYAVQTNYIGNMNRKLSLDFTIMTILIVVTTVLLIIMRGVA